MGPDPSMTNTKTRLTTGATVEEATRSLGKHELGIQPMSDEHS